MGLNPFAKRPSEEEAGAARRRSTRIDYVCPVILSGRDAAGLPFEEETTTSIVNLHGCKLSTTHDVLVGMVVTVKSRVDGSSSKAVCVHVFEAPAGESRRDIALQLVKPQNIWAVKEPPADWERVAKALVQGRSAATPHATVAASDGPPPAAPAEPQAAPPSPVAAPPNVDVQVAVLEQRAAELMESVLQIIRTQSEQIVRDAVDEFRQQVDAIAREAEERVRHQAQACYDETASSLNDLGGDLAEQLSQKTNVMSEAAEESVRAKVSEIFSSLLKGPGQPGEDPFQK